MGKGKRALQLIAEKNGISVDDVRKEIEAAIDAGMANPDSKVQVYWGSIPRTGNKPTPEEVLLFLARKIKRK